LETIRGGRDPVVGTLKTECGWHILGCAITIFEATQQPLEIPQIGEKPLISKNRSTRNVEYIPRTTMRYRMLAASVSSNSFRRRHILGKWMEGFDIYCDEDYVATRQIGAGGLKITYTGPKRMVKRLCAQAGSLPKLAVGLPT
jgi:hypothetical protein